MGGSDADEFLLAGFWTFAKQDEVLTKLSLVPWYLPNWEKRFLRIATSIGLQHVLAKERACEIY